MKIKGLFGGDKEPAVKAKAETKTKPAVKTEAKTKRRPKATSKRAKWRKRFQQVFDNNGQYEAGDLPPKLKDTGVLYHLVKNSNSQFLCVFSLASFGTLQYLCVTFRAQKFVSKNVSKRWRVTKQAVQVSNL